MQIELLHLVDMRCNDTSLTLQYFHMSPSCFSFFISVFISFFSPHLQISSFHLLLEVLLLFLHWGFNSTFFSMLPCFFFSFQTFFFCSFLCHRSQLYFTVLLHQDTITLTQCVEHIKVLLRYLISWKNLNMARSKARGNTGLSFQHRRNETTDSRCSCLFIKQKILNHKSIIKKDLYHHHLLSDRLKCNF